MILRNQQEKDNFLKECHDHIRRISRTTGFPAITQYKLKILQAIYNAVKLADMTEAGINLNNIFSVVKQRLEKNELAELPVPDAILKTHGSFDRSSNVNAIMKCHREIPFQNVFGYVLNLFRTEPLSTSFLKRSGFFNVKIAQTVSDTCLTPPSHP